MNAARILMPTVAITVCLIAASVIPVGLASAQEKEIVLRPGEVWRVYDAEGSEVGRITVDDVVEGVDVAHYYTTDPTSGQDSEKTSGTLAAVRAAITAEIMKGERANRGYFMDPYQVNFAVAGTVAAEDLAPPDEEAPAPDPSPAEAPPTPAAPVGPPGVDDAPDAPPAAPVEEDEERGLPLLPIIIAVVVIVAVIAVVMLKKRGGRAPVVADEDIAPVDEPPPPDDTGTEDRP